MSSPSAVTAFAEKRSPSSTPCIDENAIGALFDHRLSPAEADAIDRHVGSCTECRDLLASMARLYAPSAPSAAPAPVTSPFGPTVTSPGPRQGGDATIRRLLTMLGSDARIGRILAGKWRIDELLGVGGMAEVYAATHVTNGRRAAIKLLRRESLARPNIVYRFLREGYVANRVNHPGAVAILDDGTAEDGTPFLVLELLDGKTIGGHVKQDRLPVRDVLAIASDVLDVLASAHAQGIIHRDIKPDNILLTRQGAVKVLDFGIARLSESQATQLGQCIGTPAYMPPEQACGDAVIDARADIWAVGATMFALLAGRTVHGSKGPYAPAPKLATVVDVDPEIAAIVDRALEFQPDDRWPDARAMQNAIRNTLASGVWTLSIPSSAGSIAPPARPRTKRRWPVAFALVAAIGAVAATRLPKPAAMQPEPVILASPPPPPAASAAPVVVDVPAPSPVVSAASSTAKPTKRHAPAPHHAEALKPEPVAAAAPPPTPVENPHPLDRRD